MKVMAMTCNIVLFVFTCFVLMTDGPPKEAMYIVFTLWSQLTRILSTVNISRIDATDGWLNFRIKSWAWEKQKKTDDIFSKLTSMKSVTILCNIVSFGFVCWALVDQYPHPAEAGVIEFAVLMVLTPILSLMVLLRSRQIIDDPVSKHAG